MPRLQNEAVEVVVGYDAGCAVADELAVDLHRLAREVGRRERDLLQNLLQHRRKSSGADILDPTVAGHGHIGHLLDPVRSELESYALGGQERLILTAERVLGADEDRLEVGLRKPRKLDPEREPALQLRNEVRRLHP